MITHLSSLNWKSSTSSVGIWTKNIVWKVCIGWWQLSAWYSCSNIKKITMFQLRLLWTFFFSTHLAPSDFYLFPKTKKFFKVNTLRKWWSAQRSRTSCLHSLPTDEYNIGIENLMTRFYKCFNNNGDYVEN